MILRRLLPLRTLPRRSQLYARQIIQALPSQSRLYARQHWRPGFNRKVDFVVAGVKKAGTTALDAYLREHPEICMGDIKEVHFFDEDEHFSGRRPDYRVYHAFFSPRPSHKLLGDATPSDMYWPHGRERIHAYNPAMKFILLLRNPVERAYSEWNINRGKGNEKLSFWDALQSESERLRDPTPNERRRFAYVGRGRYAAQIEDIWRYFPREQTLILKSEALLQRPQETLDAICAFLGVTPMPIVSAKAENVGEYAAPMGEREAAYLETVFQPEVRALEAQLGWDCSDWLAAGAPVRTNS